MAQSTANKSQYRKNKIGAVRESLRTLSPRKSGQKAALKSFKLERDAKQQLTPTKEHQREILNELDGFPTPPMDSERGN